jgi:hypothetical protein
MLQDLISRLRTALFLLACSVSIMVLTYRTSAATSPARTKLAKIASLSAASLNRIASEAKELGLDVRAWLTPEGLETQYPFLGQGNLDADRPIGLLLYAGPEVDPTAGEGIVAVFPIKRDRLSARSLLDAGAKPVEGVTGLFELNGVAMRRSSNCLIFSVTAKAAALARGQDVLDLCKAHSGGAKSPSQEVIARFSIDIAALKQAMPQKYQGVLEQAKGAIAKNPLAARFGQEHLLDSYGDDINRLDLAVAGSDQSLSLKIGVAPVHFPPGGTFIRPQMPQGTILRLDMGAPPLKLLPWVRSALALFPGTGVLAKAPRSAQLQSTASSSQEVDEPTQILLSGQAISAGVVPGDNFAVIYLVQQHVQSDPVARMKRFAESVNLMADRYGGKSSTRVEVSQYSIASRVKIARFKVLEGTVCKNCFDFLRRGDTVYVAFSSDQGHYLETLINLPAAGQFSGLISGSASLGAFSDLIEGVARAMLPASQVHKLHDAIRDEELTLTATGEADEVIYGLSLKRSLVKELIEIVRDARR